MKVFFQSHWRLSLLPKRERCVQHLSQCFQTTLPQVEWSSLLCENLLSNVSKGLVMSSFPPLTISGANTFGNVLQLGLGSAFSDNLGPSSCVWNTPTSWLFSLRWKSHHVILDIQLKLYKWYSTSRSLSKSLTRWVYHQHLRWYW